MTADGFGGKAFVEGEVVEHNRGARKKRRCQHRRHESIVKVWIDDSMELQVGSNRVVDMNANKLAVSHLFCRTPVIVEGPRAEVH